MASFLTRKKVDKKSYEDKTKFMTEEEIEEISDLISIASRRSEEARSQIIEEVKKCDAGYNGKQEERSDRPNTKVNIIHPNVEGQVADISLQELGVIVEGEEYTDQQFADDVRMNIEWDLAHQSDMVNIKANFVRRMIKYGFAFFKCTFDETKFAGFGLSVIETPMIDRVFCDGKITDPTEIQKGEYVFEVIPCTRQQAINVYGKEKAEDINYGRQAIEKEGIFSVDEYMIDDPTAWTLIQWWDRKDTKLRCREFTAQGLLLWDSAKGKDRKENQIDNDYTDKPIYEYVDNKYPYIMRNCYSEEGKLYGFGDVKLINNLQDLLNTLYDNIRMATKPKRPLIDTASDIDPAELETDVFQALPFNGEQLGGRPPIYNVDFSSTNTDWYHMIGNIHNEIQRVIRYSELMLGQSGSTKTATEAAIQERQGSRATSMKQRTVESALAEVILYGLALDLQFRTGKRAMRVRKDKNEMAFVDYDLLKNMPSTVPMEGGERELWRQEGYENSEIPNHMLAKESNGETITRRIAVDVKVKIGASIPSSPALMANMMTQYASMQLMSADGTPRPAVTWEEFRKYLVDNMGLPLDSVESIKEQLRAYEEIQKEQQQQMMEQQAMANQQQAEGLPSSLPNGSAASIQDMSSRKQMGVMEGNQDFQQTM